MTEELASSENREVFRVAANTLKDLNHKNHQWQTEPCQLIHIALNDELLIWGQNAEKRDSTGRAGFEPATPD